jgi:glycosyltransferase involved in cell wall biosynthesis
MTGPLRPRLPHVLTLGDLIWYRYPDTIDLKTRLVWRTLVPRIARSADRVVTFSNASKQDAVKALGLPAGKIAVVPLGPGTDDVANPTPEAQLRERLGLRDRRVVLSVSAKRPHKNLARLIRSMRQVLVDAPDAVLVLPGRPTPHEEDLRRLADEEGLSDAVLFPEYLSAADLEGLYGLASCFVFPSLREGFGLPVLEAMRRGLPVACSRAPALPEVAGEAAAYFEPEDEAEMARTITTLLTDRKLAEQLSRLGLVRQSHFTWRATAEGTITAYEQAVAARR